MVQTKKLPRKASFLLTEDTELTISSKKKVSDSDGFTGKFHQIFKKQLPNSATYLRKQKHREHFLIHPMKPTLPYYQNHIMTLQQRKIVD
jgi:hypothetical protein